MTLFVCQGAGPLVPWDEFLAFALGAAWSCGLMQSPTILAASATNSLEVIMTAIVLAADQIVDPVRRPQTKAAITGQFRRRWASRIRQIARQFFSEIFQDGCASGFIAFWVMPWLESHRSLVVLDCSARTMLFIEHHRAGAPGRAVSPESRVAPPTPAQSSTQFASPRTQTTMDGVPCAPDVLFSEAPQRSSRGGPRC
jgi:hypothetical protein